MPNAAGKDPTEMSDSGADRLVMIWKMSWILPFICSFVLLLSSFWLFKEIGAASYLLGAFGMTILVGTPHLLKTCRIEMTRNRITIYDLLGKVTKELRKEDIVSVESRSGEEVTSWVHTKSGKYFIPRVYLGVNEVLDVLSGWATENSNENLNATSGQIHRQESS